MTQLSDGAATLSARIDDPVLFDAAMTSTVLRTAGQLSPAGSHQGGRP